MSDVRPATDAWVDALASMLAPGVEWNSSVLLALILRIRADAAVIRALRLELDLARQCEEEPLHD